MPEEVVEVATFCEESPEQLMDQLRSYEQYDHIMALPAQSFQIFGNTKSDKVKEELVKCIKSENARESSHFITDFNLISSLKEDEEWKLTGLGMVTRNQASIISSFHVHDMETLKRVTDEETFQLILAVSVNEHSLGSDSHLNYIDTIEETTVAWKRQLLARLACSPTAVGMGYHQHISVLNRVTALPENAEEKGMKLANQYFKQDWILQKTGGFQYHK